MEVKIVLGFAFGDEGKGVTTQWLVQQALEQNKRVAVVRFSGGPQAAHTIRQGTKEHICSTYGSGVLLGVPTIYLDSVYFDPICAYNETKVLEEKEIIPKLMIPKYLRIITPYDVIAGQQNAKVLKDGTCGKGIYSTFCRYNVHEYDILPESYEECDALLEKARTFHHLHKLDEDILDAFKEAVAHLRVHYYSEEQLEKFDTLIFEGTQGLLLDMNHGYYPNVTPSMVGLNGIPSKYLFGAQVYLVTRTYLTRHGNGYTPRYPCSFNLKHKYETNVCNQYQGSFKTGALEVDLLNDAIFRHSLSFFRTKKEVSYNLVWTHMDVVPDKEFFMDLYTPKIELPFNSVYYNEGPESNLRRYI